LIYAPRMLRSHLGLALVSLVLACGGGGASGSAGALPAGDAFVLVTVRLEDAMISPVKADGKPWDVATPLVEPAARSEIVAAMNKEKDPRRAYDAAAAAIAKLGDAWGRPDVAGRAIVDQNDGKQDTRTFESGLDTFTPHIGVEWTHVPLSHWTTMHMYFVEKDPGGTQDIGNVVLSAHDLAKALERRGETHHVRVDDQTNGQVLYVGIVVTAE
jgi:hypothetical protein